MTGPDVDLREVLLRPVAEAAPLLLGAVVSHGAVSVRLTEVEAYGGSDDAGSHAFRGRTTRNTVMFGPAGHLYAYLSYGVHVCANVATGEEGVASAVLLRAGEVVAGLEVARERRPGASDRDLARGPGRLCRVLGVTLAHDGVDLTEGPVRLRPGPPPVETACGPRVGLRGDAERPWRFWMPGEPTVSVYRRAVRRAPST